MPQQDDFVPILSSVIRSLPQAVIVVDGDGQIRLVNDVALEVFGYGRRDMLAINLDTIVPARFRVQHRPGEHLLITGRRKDGAEFPAEATISPLAIPDSPKMVMVILSDILASASASSETLSALDQIEDAILILDKEWRYLFANETALQGIRKRRTDVIGSHSWDLFPELLGTEVERACRSAMASQQRTVVEYLHEASGRWFKVNLIPSPSTMTIHAKEITGIKTALALSERLEQTLDSVPDPVYVLDKQWRYAFVNLAACDYMKKERSAVLGRSLYDLYPDVRGTSWEAVFIRAMSADKPFSEEDYYSANGRWYKMHFFPVKDGMVIHAVETTALRKQEQAIAHSLSSQTAQAEMYRAFDMMPDPVCVMDQNNRFAYINQAALDVNRRRREDMLGKRPDELEPPVKRTRLHRAIEKALRLSKQDHFEYHLEPAERWFRVGLFPSGGQVIVMAVDITKLKDQERSIGILTDALDTALDKGWDRKTGRGDHRS